MQVDLPTTAPGWPCYCRGVNGSCLKVDSAPMPSPVSTDSVKVKSEEPLTSLGNVIEACSLNLLIKPAHITLLFLSR